MIRQITKIIGWMVFAFSLILVAGTLMGLGECHAASISGTVVGEDDPAAGLIGYDVYVRDGDNIEIATTTTTTGGSYIVSGLPSQDGLYVGVYPPSQPGAYFSQWYQNKEYLGEADPVSTASGELTGIDFVLEPVHDNYVDGKLVDDQGAGISGVWVDLTSHDRNFGKRALTETDGSFRIAGIRTASDFLLSAPVDSGQGYTGNFFYDIPDTGTAGVTVPTRSAYHYRDATRIKITETSQFSKMDLIADFSEGRIIEGRVTAQDTSLGLEDYTVEISTDDYSFDEYAYTEPDGTYLYWGVPPADNIIIQVHPPGPDALYMGEYYDGVYDSSQATRLNTLAGDLSNIDFTLKRQPDNQVAGQVKDANGDGISDQWTYAQSESLDFYKGVRTDANGNFVIKGLEPASDYMVITYYESQDLTAEFFYAIPDGETVGVYVPAYSEMIYEKATLVNMEETTKLSNMDIIVDPSYGGQISGHVYKADKTSPVEGVEVHAWSDGLEEGNSAVTDANGYYVIRGLTEVKTDVQTNGYVVHTCPPDYVCTIYNGVYSWDEATTLGTDSSGIDFTLGNEVTISGVVRDENNNPLKNADVTAWSATHDNYEWARTNGFGQYTITGLPPAPDYIVYAFSSGYPTMYYNQQRKEADADPIDLTAGDVSGIDFKLSQGGIIKGKAHFADNPLDVIPGTAVEVWSESAQIGNGSVTDQTGHFRISGLDPNVSDYIISFQVPGYPVMFYKDNETSVYDSAQAEKVGPSATTSRVLVVQRGYDLSGAVLNNGVPVPGVKISVWSDVTRIWHDTVTSSKLSGGANYTMQGLLAGTYDMYVEPPEQFATQTKTITLTGDMTGVDFNLGAYPGRSITGTISGLGSGETASLHAWSESTEGGNSVQITGTGNPLSYTITGLKPAGDYVVEFYSANYPYLTYDNAFNWEQATRVDVSAQNAANIDFDLTKLPALGSISGSVTFPGSAQAGESVWVEAWSEGTGSYNGADVELTNPGQPAPYTINGLIQAEDYLVSVWSEDYISRYYSEMAGITSNQLDATLVDNKNQVADNINFVLGQGVSISGTVSDESGNPISGVGIFAWSEKSGSGAEVKTDAGGRYTLKGLAGAPDFVVGGGNESRGQFFYNENRTVRNWALAGKLDTRNGSLTGIDMVVSKGETIAGAVSGSNGKKLANVWVSAWSESVQGGNGAFTNGDGDYKISGLTRADDYLVLAEPPWGSDFIPQVKKLITTGRTDVNFLLPEKTGSFTIGGTVSGNLGAPVSGIDIRIWSPSMKLYAYGNAVTNIQGEYEIGGLPAGNDYIFVATPRSSSPKAMKVLTDVVISGDNLNFDVALDGGRTVGGKVTDTMGNDLKDILIIVKSESTDIIQKTKTSSLGWYTFTNIPKTADFTVTAKASGYKTEKKNVDFPATGPAKVDFTLRETGTISGVVMDQSEGGHIESALVEASAVGTSGAGIPKKSVRTDESGKYVLDELLLEDIYGNSIFYTVQAKADCYDPRKKSDIYPKSTVNFTLAKNPEGMISGTVDQIYDSELIDTFSIVNVYNTNDEKVTHAEVDPATGDFTVCGLTPNLNYRLLFIAYYSYNPNREKYVQWLIDGNNMGYMNSPDPYVMPGNTRDVTTSDSVVFYYDTAILAPRYTVLKRPDPVKNLQSTSHPYVNLGAFTQSSRSTVQSLQMEPSLDITNTPNVTVSWEASGDTGAETYYYAFNETVSYVIDKRNAVQPGSTSTTITSRPLSGDFVPKYFHVAVEDDRGRIGDTLHLAFIIDTVAPKNPVALAKADENTSETGNIDMELGASNAVEMYLSNTSFGEGGEWEGYKTSRKWKISANTDKVYVQYRDEANNVSGTLASIDESGVGPLGEAIKGMQVLSGQKQDSYSDADADGDFKIGLIDVLMKLQEDAELR